MHELSIAESIADSVRQHAALRGGRRVRRIGVRVGDTSGVNAEALDFCFAIVVRGTDLEGAALDLERVPVRFRCEACGHEFEPAEFDPRCPACGVERGRLSGGDELSLAYLELDDEEPGRPGETTG
jgi:hydrogenase nickel incorporation protein HypA/HybF